MKLLVVGGGGREHAIIKKLAESPRAEKIYAAPGNGGIAALAECVALDPKDLAGITAFAKEKRIDFCVVAPDDPLVLGLVDELHKAGIPCFGPDKKAAFIEGSKAYAKELMKKYDIPTAAYETFTQEAAALAYLETAAYPLVVKADGLALGKGVIIAQTKEEARDAVHSMMGEKIFGASGSKIVVEEFLTGPEVSVLAFTDGKTLVPMVSSMDHKRALEGDQGLNTGGMGTVAPNPYYTPAMAKTCMQEIFLPTIKALNQEGRTFKGCLYFGLMLTPKGPKVIEYNCRFGDPETQVVLPLLQTDLLTIMEAVEAERLEEIAIEWRKGAAACVILASGGYPRSYQKGFPITFGSWQEVPEAVVYHAGTKLAADGSLVTSGGRVLGVTAVGADLSEALKRAYAAADQIRFEGAFCRRDIGQRALAALGKGN